jgi:hypothetical protein
LYYSARQWSAPQLVAGKAEANGLGRHERCVEMCCYLCCISVQWYWCDSVSMQREAGRRRIRCKVYRNSSIHASRKTATKFVQAGEQQRRLVNGHCRRSDFNATSYTHSGFLQSSQSFALLLQCPLYIFVDVVLHCISCYQTSEVSMMMAFAMSVERHRLSSACIAAGRQGVPEQMVGIATGFGTVFGLEFTSLRP